LKFETLCDLYSRISIEKAIIFCNSVRKVNWLAEQMDKESFAVSVMVRQSKKKEKENKKSRSIYKFYFSLS
jgi:superfamily II DNA/RNA helicase